MKTFLNYRFCLLPLVAVFSFSAQTNAHANCASIADCELVWSDEFDSATLDLSKWEPMIGNGALYGLPGWGNNELQYYQAENATLANGVLTIEARQENVAGFGYTSARLRTLGLGDWTYGRFEMRAKLPVGQGMWPAFWMLSSQPQIYGVWAASGEIDIMESLGDQPERIFGTIHYGGSFPENESSSSNVFLPAGTVNEFHEYAIEWRPGEIRWYLDGQLYATRTAWSSSGGPFPAPFDVDFHLLLNLAIGGNFPGNPDGTTQFPQRFDVDYVRVYQSDSQAASDPSFVYDDMEHAKPFDNGWFDFGGSVGGGGIGVTGTDLPAAVGGDYALNVGFGSSGASGFFGGFGRTSRETLAGIETFSFMINPDANQSYTLEVNLQEDDNQDFVISSGSDDEFQFNCVVSPTGPCAISGGGWQRVTIPLADFFDDNSFINGGNGQLDANGGSEGLLTSIVFAIIGTSGSDVSFRTDYWTFDGPIIETDGDGIDDVNDNCLLVPNAEQRDSDGDGFGNICDQDLNNDCIVNFVDLGLLKQVFFSSGADIDADFNGDGTVNFIDLGFMRAGIFLPPGPSGTVEQCVPES